MTVTYFRLFLLFLVVPAKEVRHGQLLKGGVPIKPQALTSLALALLVAPALGNGPLGEISIIPVGGADPGSPPFTVLLFTIYDGVPPGDCAPHGGNPPGTGEIFTSGLISCNQANPADMAAAIAAGMNPPPPGWAVNSADAKIIIVSPPGVNPTCRVNSTEERHNCFGYDVPPNVNNVCAGQNVNNGRAAHVSGWNFSKLVLDIPTISEWGLIVMTLLLLTAGTVVFGRRRRRAVA